MLMNSKHLDTNLELNDTREPEEWTIVLGSEKETGEERQEGKMKGSLKNKILWWH